MPSAKDHVVVSTEIPEVLRKRIDRRAREEGRSRAKVVHRAILFYLQYAPVVPEDTVPAPEKNGRETP